MLENLSNKVSTISSNTQIVFTMKNFSALIIGILALFFGFYQLVVVPKIDFVEAQFNKQVQQNQLFYQELGKINTAINTLNTSIELLKQQQENSIYMDRPTGGQFELSEKLMLLDSIELNEIKELLVTLDDIDLRNHKVP